MKILVFLITIILYSNNDKLFGLWKSIEENNPNYINLKSNGDLKMEELNRKLNKLLLQLQTNEKTIQNAMQQTRNEMELIRKTDELEREKLVQNVNQKMKTMNEKQMSIQKTLEIFTQRKFIFFSFCKVISA